MNGLHIYSGNMQDEKLMAICGKKLLLSDVAHSYEDVGCTICLRKRIGDLDNGHEHNKKSVAILKGLLEKIEKDSEPFNDYYRQFPHGLCENNFQCGGAYVCSLTNGLCNSNYEDMRCNDFKNRGGN